MTKYLTSLLMELAGVKSFKTPRSDGKYPTPRLRPHRRRRI